MGYLKTVLAASVAGLLSAIAFTTVAGFIAFSRLQSVTTCVDFQCVGVVQVVSVRDILIAFAVGFALASAWFLRRRRRLIAS